MIRVGYFILLAVLLSIAVAERKDAEYWIKRLNMSDIGNGLYFSRVYVSSEINRDLPERYGEGAERNFGSHSYALMQNDDLFTLRRIKSDGIWHHYHGATLTVYIIDQTSGKLRKVHLGPLVGRFVLTINHGDWVGAKLRSNKVGSYCIFGGTVIPGFEFEDKEDGDRKKLLVLYPQHEKIIKKLTSG